MSSKTNRGGDVPRRPSPRTRQRLITIMLIVLGIIALAISAYLMTQFLKAGDHSLIVHRLTFWLHPAVT